MSSWRGRSLIVASLRRRIVSFGPWPESDTSAGACTVLVIPAKMPRCSIATLLGEGEKTPGVHGPLRVMVEERRIN